MRNYDAVINLLIPEVVFVDKDWLLAMASRKCLAKSVCL